MSARDVIAGVFRLQHRDLCYPDASSGECLIAADAIIAELEASGRSIVHKDEIHAPSVERAIAVALAEPEMPGEPPEAVLKSMLEAGPVETARASCRATKSGIAAALRELMKEVGR